MQCGALLRASFPSQTPSCPCLSRSSNLAYMCTLAQPNTTTPRLPHPTPPHNNCTAPSRHTPCLPPPPSSATHQTLRARDATRRRAGPFALRQRCPADEPDERGKVHSCNLPHLHLPSAHLPSHAASRVLRRPPTHGFVPHVSDVRAVPKLASSAVPQSCFAGHRPPPRAAYCAWAGRCPPALCPPVSSLLARTHFLSPNPHLLTHFALVHFALSTTPLSQRCPLCSCSLIPHSLCSLCSL